MKRKFFQVVIATIVFLLIAFSFVNAIDGKKTLTGLEWLVGGASGMISFLIVLRWGKEALKFIRRVPEKDIPLE